MYKKITVIKDVVETRKYCDICETDIITGLACSAAKCECCGKDLCDKCVGHEDYSTGDYRTVYCNKCWDIGDDFRAEIKQLEAKIDMLYEEWQSRCNCSR